MHVGRAVRQPAKQPAPPETIHCSRNPSGNRCAAPKNPRGRIWRGWYPDALTIKDYNALVLERFPAKKKDRHELLSYTKLCEAVEECEQAGGDAHYKAAVLLRAITQKHPFASGNRRTALFATKTFLKENGAEIGASMDETAMSVMQGVREGFYTLEDIQHWLKTGDIHEFKRA